MVAWLSEDSLQGIDLRLPNLLPFPPNTNPQVQLFRNRPHFTAGCYPKPLPPISDMNPKCVSLAGLRISTFFPPSGRAVPRGVSSTAFFWSSIRNNNRASALARAPESRPGRRQRCAFSDRLSWRGSVTTQSMLAPIISVETWSRDGVSFGASPSSTFRGLLAEWPASSQLYNDNSELWQQQPLF